jgi:hypothetical protein
MATNSVSEELLKDLVCILLIGGSDTAARAIVERELGAHGIKHFIEGSVVYTVLVHKADAPKALEILKSSEQLKSHWHQFTA